MCSKKIVFKSVYFAFVAHRIFSNFLIVKFTFKPQTISHILLMAAPVYDDGFDSSESCCCSATKG